MEYKLYKGYILGPGFQNPAYDIYEVDIYKSKADVGSENSFHTSESEWEATLWIDREKSEEGFADQSVVDELNRAVVPTPLYPDNIMRKVRQNLGVEEYDTSRDKEINEMSHDEVFRKCLEWEGIIGYEYNIKNWVQSIYGVTLS